MLTLGLFLICCATLAYATGSDPEPASQSVEVAVEGGLGIAAVVLQARFGTTINYESIPMVTEGLHYKPFVWADGSLHYTPILPGILRFMYSSNGTVEQAVQSAVDAYNQLPAAVARYRVDSHDDVLDLVPTEVLTVSGWTSYVSPLDTVITLDPAEGQPRELWHRAVEALEDVPVAMGNDRKQAMAEYTYPPATVPRSAPARVILAQILSASIYANRWELGYVLPNLPISPGWMLRFDQLQPVDEQSSGNLTPLESAP
ncbi:MAG: hypothetical protein R2724_34795 [Bryobacterales bacterium]